MTPPALVGRTALLLGFAGLLPQVAAVLAAGWGRWSGVSAALASGAIVGLVYALVILSFLGGIWWGFAMRRDAGQGPLAAAAVGPSLAAIALLAVTVFVTGFGWGLVAIGSVLMLTLPLDRALVRSGDAPANWLRLRVPLSLGLGGLTILLGVLVGSGSPIF